MLKIFCNRCGQETNHEVLYVHNNKWKDKDLEKLLREEEPDAEAWYYTTIDLLICCGCDHVTTRHRICMGEEMQTEEQLRESFGEEWQGFLRTNYYPPLSARRKPKWLSEYDLSYHVIPESIRELLDEIYIALQNGSVRLVGMGIRAALEMIMIEKIGDQGSFWKNIDAFIGAGYLSLRQRNTLEAVLEAGHAAIHRGWKPTAADIVASMDILESAVETTYVHEPLAKHVEGGIPRRRPRFS